jgi:hypothetical protein
MGQASHSNIAAAYKDDPVNIQILNQIFRTIKEYVPNSSKSQEQKTMIKNMASIHAVMKNNHFRAYMKYLSAAYSNDQ